MRTAPLQDSNFTGRLEAPCRKDVAEPTPSVDGLAYNLPPTPLAGSFDTEKLPPNGLPDFPDGGLRAWSVVIGVSRRTPITFHIQPINPNTGGVYVIFDVCTLIS